MTRHYLDFEQPIADLEAKIQDLRQASSGPAVNIDAELRTLQDKLRLRTAQGCGHLAVVYQTHGAAAQPAPRRHRHAVREQSDLVQDHALAGRDAFQCGDEPVGRHRLGDVAVGAGRESASDSARPPAVRRASSFAPSTPEGKGQRPTCRRISSTSSGRWAATSTALP